MIDLSALNEEMERRLRIARDKLDKARSRLESRREYQHLRVGLLRRSFGPDKAELTAPKQAHWRISGNEVELAAVVSTLLAKPAPMAAA